MSLDAIRARQLMEALRRADAVSERKPVAKADFGRALAEVLHEVNAMQQAAGKSVDNLLAGRVENLHEVMVAMGKAQVSFQFMAQVRNRLLEAYREVMRMQV